jgi:hypothetical protein
MEDFLVRGWEALIGRLSGPMQFRLVLQPLAAIIIAIRAGVRDARGLRPLYFWSIFRERGRRGEIIREGWRDVGQVFVVAVIIDCVYQLYVLRWFYPGQSVIVAAVLAVVPYLIFRGTFNRIWRYRQDSKSSKSEKE